MVVVFSLYAFVEYSMYICSVSRLVISKVEPAFYAFTVCKTTLKCLKYKLLFQKVKITIWGFQ